MTFDLAMIYADIASTASVALMLWIVRTLQSHDHRLQKIESDLYVDCGNPTSLPLTKQVYNIQQDVQEIKTNQEGLKISFEGISTRLTDCLSVLPLKKEKEKPKNKKTK